MNETPYQATHLPCPECPSSDAYTIFKDGHGHCYSCGYHTVGKGQAEVQTVVNRSFTPLVGDYSAHSKRRISENTCRKFGYFISTSSKLGPVQVANYYDKNRQLIAQHIRGEGKQFRWLGDVNKVGLFGQHAWASGGKRIVVVEGEIDSMSLSEAMGNSWPVVSVHNGADSAKKYLSHELEWLESFDEIVLCFDNDEPGRKAAVECAELFTPGKCKIAMLPLKDANDMWVAGRGKELTAAVMFNAQVYRPDGIICGSDEKISEHIISFTPHADASYPWPYLNESIHGMRLGELVTHTAGTGIGRSTICREIAYHLGVVLGQRVGIVSLWRRAWVVMACF